MKHHWMVIGAGPLGLAYTGRLLDFADAFSAHDEDEWMVHWVDPSFDMGRMGKYYRNVPSNTNNGDYLTAFRLVKSFEYDARERKKVKERGEGAYQCLSELDPERCASLDVFINAATETQQHIMPRVHWCQGMVTRLEAMPTQRWKVTIQQMQGDETSDQSLTEIECDAVIYCCGCQPVVLDNLEVLKQSAGVPYVQIHGDSSLGSGDLMIHSLDYTVNPRYCEQLVAQPSNAILPGTGGFRSEDDGRLIRDEPWAVVGSSHSAMLVVKNLHEAGVREITLLHQSEFRFMHQTAGGWMRYQGIGLKGPVGDWVKVNCCSRDASDSSTDSCNLRKIRTIRGKSTLEQLHEYSIRHAVAAIGFERNQQQTPIIQICTNDSTRPMTVPESLLDQYNKETGEIIPHAVERKSDDMAASQQWHHLSKEDAESMPMLFGGGIAFPQDLIDGGGNVEPWVGFKRSAQQTSLMMKAYLSRKRLLKKYETLFVGML